MRITRLTTTGTADSAAISPDGKYIVQVASENGQQSLRVRQVNTNSDVQIVPPSNLHYADLTFSPDGDFLYYIASEQNGSSSNLYVIPALGGNPRKVTSNVTGSVALSADGQQLAFIRNLPAVGEDAVFIANVNGGEERKLAARKLPNFFRSVCWSPDKAKLIAAAGSFVPIYNSYLVELPIGGGNEKQLGQQTWQFIGDISWVSDNQGLIFAASDQESGNSKQLWYVSYPAGEARRITNDLNNYNGVSVTGDSRRLVTLQAETTSNIWLANNGDFDRTTQLTLGSGRIDGHDGLAWTADGQLVYSSQANGAQDLWIMKADGSNKRQLTSNSRNNHHPIVTPDGKYIVFASDRAGTPNIWRVDIDGSNPRQLTSGSGETRPHCTPDGKWVVYTLLGAGKPTVWRVSIEGGAPQQLINEYATAPAVSPDGKSIACFYRDEQANSRVRLALFNSEGGQAVRTFEIAGLPVDSSNWPSLGWSNDSRAVNYVVTVGGVSNIWTQSISGEPVKQLTNFKSDRIFAFAWSRDSKQLAFSRGSVSSDVVLISNFQ
jgi:Tol biopolymer transport system component